MKTRSLAKLVRVRTRQRNLATARLRQATAQLDRSREAETEAVEAVRALAHVDETPAHEVDRREATAQRRAAQVGHAEHQVVGHREDLQRAAMALHRAEVLLERARTREAAVRRRLEQREQDEIASRRGGSA
ncbi:MAG: hypothetical protein B7733_09520 [Myxococcales bacterium FL481]|nr:MAG: hypothetical protein B7733_09520 [Myxococcales bacterium FL481]